MKSIKDVDVKNKKVLVREDFNVPLDNGNVVDDTKLKKAIPTINYLREKGAKIILMSDLGDPQGHAIPALRMDSVAQSLERLLGLHIENIDEITGDIVRETISRSLIPGEVMMLENLGFSRGEYNNNQDFAKELASLADIYVNDALSIADKEYASNVGITNYIPSYAGFQIEETKQVSDFLKNIDHPFVLLVAGSNPESKMPLIEKFVSIADFILVAGEVGLAFMKAQGYDTGKIDISDKAVEMAKQLISESVDEKHPIIIPDDFLVAKDINPDAERLFASNQDIPSNGFVVDIGPKTLMEFDKYIYDARLVLWDGAVGNCEIPEFSYGTSSIVQSIASTDAKTVVAGDETLKLVDQYKKNQYINVLLSEDSVISHHLTDQEKPAIRALNQSKA